MNVNSINFITDSLIENKTDSISNQIGSESFKLFYDSAVGLLEETNNYQLQSQQMQLDYVTGQTDDIIGLSMAQSRASTAIEFTSQAVNKLLTAYQEIMRITL